MVFDAQRALDLIKRITLSVRRGLSWDQLLRISCSQLVMVGSYATLLVPIVAHVFLLAKHIHLLPSDFSHISSELAHSSCLPTADSSVGELMEAPLWKYLTTQVYVGGGAIGCWKNAGSTVMPRHDSQVSR